MNFDWRFCIYIYMCIYIYIYIFFFYIEISSKTLEDYFSSISINENMFNGLILTTLQIKNLKFFFLSYLMAVIVNNQCFFSWPVLLFKTESTGAEK